MKPNQGHCYIWNEAECNRGANDIASFMWRWLQDKEKQNVKRVIFYSDTRGGQNRNQIIITALVVFLAKSNMTSIEQKFFERGHSKMEADSMHSAIKGQFDKKNIFLPSGYMECMLAANKKNPYHVHEVTHSDIMDFDAINKQYFKQDAFNGILKVHHITCAKSDGDIKVKFA
ncbi:DNA repair protein rhp54 [Elysia marginata]|uniref:DNA repair protein rhp54 n=1 Tax=Elysia marginata TaxID=1093978 RepID=A0AAV4GCC0_9GAST|nr:DNA repair protein rhp54 [Elysia marginata]